MDTNPFLNESSAVGRPALHAVPSDPTTAQSVLGEALLSDHWFAASVASAAAEVGGIDALERLDAEPLRGDPLDWSVIGASERELVEEVVALIEAAKPGLLDDEYVLIVHRIIERLAVCRPDLLQRGPADRLAAALGWLALGGNGQLSQGRGGLKAQVVWEHFGVSNSADRGRTLYRALGLPRPGGVHTMQWNSKRADTWLYDPTLLHSKAREELVQRRAGLERLCAKELERDRESRPFGRRTGGQVRISARPVHPSGAIFSQQANGQELVLVMLGGTPFDPAEVLALTLEEAEQLMQYMDRAIANPMSTW